MKKTLIIILLALSLLTQAAHIQSDETEILNQIDRELNNLDYELEKPDYKKIDTALLQLIRDENSSHHPDIGLLNSFELIDNKLRVEVSLKDEINLFNLSRFNKEIVVENHYKSLAQILVPQYLLKELSNEEYINFIRRPIKPCLDDITSEGVSVIGADNIHIEGFYGSGVKVAVIDMGFQGYSTNPELPSERIKEIKSFRSDGDIEAGTSHGSACAEIILDVAPQADLYLYNFDTISELNAAVSRAISKGVDIISFSIGYVGINDYNGVGYSSIGDVCGIVDNAYDNEILFITSMGNAAQRHYQGYFHDTDGDDFHEFDSGYETLILDYIPYGGYIHLMLSWNDWPYSNQDFDLYLFDSDLNLVSYSNIIQDGTNPPREGIIVYAPYGDYYQVVIRKYSATKNVHFELFSFENNFYTDNHPISSLTCPADAYGSLSVGATYYGDDDIEPFSSQGPTNDMRLKPELTAPDGVSTYAYGADDFYGTSASTPHTAGVAALLLSVAPDLTVDDLESKLVETAKDLGDIGEDYVYGYGRINVWDAYNYIIPTASFSHNPLNPDTTTILQFNDTSIDDDGSIASWSWDFGDGIYSNLQNPTHQYTDNGTYTVTLNITDDDGATGSISKQITVDNTAPVANFSYNPLMPTDLDVISFTDCSIDNDGLIVNWSWDFGDGIYSNLQNPTHQYTDNGTYTVTLNITDDDGYKNQVNKEISIINIGPTANYTYNPQNPTDIQIISFSDLSSDPDGVITAWSWDFGDNNISTNQNPTHQYTNNGIYTVTLNVTDDDGATDQITKVINILNVEPESNFTFFPLQPNIFDPVEFTDTSTDVDGIINSWEWDFGDGTSSTDQHPVHNYSENGTYDISLSVTDNDGDENSISKQITVYLGPNANFTFEPNYPTIGQKVYFNDSSIDLDGKVVNWSWEINNEFVSFDRNITHTFDTAGCYLIRLNVTDDTDLTGSSSKKININVAPEANFSYQPLNPFTTDLISFNDTTTDIYGEPINWSWDFGDGNISQLRNTTHRYADNGTYIVTLTVTDNLTATDIKQKEIKVLNTPPYANFTFSPVNPTDLQKISLNDTSIDCDGEIVNWTWNLGDGTICYGKNISHQYLDNGNYDIVLNVTDDDGGSNETTRNIVVLNVAPTVDYSFNPYAPKCDEVVLFNSTAIDFDGSVTNFTWTIDDTNLYYTQNISHTFSLFGSHQINLTIRDNDDAEAHLSKTIIMRNTSTNTTFENDTTIIDLIDVFDILLKINTTNQTQVNISKYSDNPTDESTLYFTSLGKYYEITVKDESKIIWPITINIFYTSDELSNSQLNQTQLVGLWNWNESTSKWELYENSGWNTTNRSDYQGYVWAEIWHLTNITPGGDCEPPDGITGLSVSDAKDGKLALNWNEPNDNVAVDHYCIFRDDNLIHNTTITSFTDTNLENGKTYLYQISAVDSGYNEGEKSISVSGKPTKTVTSSGGSGGGGGGFMPPAPTETNTPPVANISINQLTGFTGESITFDGSGSYDEEGNITSWVWDFGDGTTGKGSVVSHVFTSTGLFEVSLTVSDEENETDSCQVSISISQANRAPEIIDITGPRNGSVDQSYEFVILASDLDNDSVYFVVNWNDGSDLLETDQVGSGESTIVSHSWNSPGFYLISVYAVDSENATSSSSEKMLSIGAMFCQDVGYFLDDDGDGIYDRLYSNETQQTNDLGFENNEYLLDTNDDGEWDYRYTEGNGLSTIGLKKADDTPGFELVLLIFILFSIIIWKRKKR